MQAIVDSLLRNAGKATKRRTEAYLGWKQAPDGKWIKSDNEPVNSENNKCENPLYSPEQDETLHNFVCFNCAEHNCTTRCSICNQVGGMVRITCDSCDNNISDSYRPASSRAAPRIGIHFSEPKEDQEESQRGNSVQQVSGGHLRSEFAALRTTSPNNKNTYVVGENAEAVETVKALLSEAPFNIPTVTHQAQASFVILIFEHAQFDQVNHGMAKALSICTSMQQKVMVLYIASSVDQDVQQLISKLPGQYKFIQHEEWTPWYQEPDCDMYREAALSSILRTHELLDGQYYHNFQFFLSHMQRGSQGVAGFLYAELCYKWGFRVWWDMSAANLTTNGMQLGVKHSENFILVLHKNTLSSEFVRMETQTALEEKKNIVVLYDTKPSRYGATKDELVANIENNYESLKQLISAKWIQVNLRISFADSMILKLLKACGYEAPNVSLNQEFENISGLVGRLSDDSTLSGLETKVIEYAKYFCEGTREWVLQHLSKWSNTFGVANKVCAVVGPAGIGKSVLASRIIQLSQMIPKPEIRVVGYHLFAQDDPDFASQRSCIFSLCKQLREDVKGFRKVCDRELGKDDISELSISELFNRVLVKPANKLKQDFRVVVVLDALEECKDSHNFHREIVTRWYRKMPNWLGLLVTCQSSVFCFPDQVEQQSEAAINIIRLDADDERNQEDLKKFAKTVLENHFKDETQLDQAVDVVVEKSEGLFLNIRLYQENQPGNSIRSSLEILGLSTIPQFSTTTTTAPQPEMNIYVVGENSEVVEKVKQMLTEAPFGLPTVADLSQSSFVILVVENVEFHSNRAVKKALSKCKSEEKQLMVLFVSHGDDSLSILIHKIPWQYLFLKNVEWVEWYPEPASDRYRIAALDCILRMHRLLDGPRYHQHFHFYLCHDTHGSGDVVAGILNHELCKWGFRVWWNKTATEVTIRASMRGVENSDNFILVLYRRTIFSYYVQIELEEAVKHGKNIVVLFDKNRSRNGANRSELIETIFIKPMTGKLRRRLLSSTKWIPVNLRGSFCDVMVLELLDACGYEAPYQLLKVPVGGLR